MIIGFTMDFFGKIFGILGTNNHETLCSKSYFVMKNVNKVDEGDAIIKGKIDSGFYLTHILQKQKFDVERQLQYGLVKIAGNYSIINKYLHDSFSGRHRGRIFIPVILKKKNGERIVIKINENTLIRWNSIKNLNTNEYYPTKFSNGQYCSSGIINHSEFTKKSYSDEKIMIRHEFDDIYTYNTYVYGNLKSNEMDAYVIGNKEYVIDEIRKLDNCNKVLDICHPMD